MRFEQNRKLTTNTYKSKSVSQRRGNTYEIKQKRHVNGGDLNPLVHGIFIWKTEWKQKWDVLNKK